MNDILRRVNEKIAYTRSLIRGCSTLYRFAINEVCPASWEDRRINISALMETQHCYEAELKRYMQRLTKYQRFKQQLLERREP